MRATALVGAAARRILTARLADQFRAGARLGWVVDPARRRVTVHRPDGARVVLGGAETLDGGEVLPGFAVPVAALFASLATLATLAVLTRRERDVNVT